MSIVSQLGENYCNLVTLLDTYSNDIAEVKNEISMKGKNIMDANIENTSYLHYYDQRRIELHTLVKYFRMEENKVKSELYKKYKENYNRALGERDIIRYVDGHSEYLKIHALLIEIEELYEMYDSVVSSFNSRKFILTNVTKLRIAELESVEL